MRKSLKRSLTRDDWIAAALKGIARGGFDAVAVEPIAETLGATKGSFYWHFKNRDELVDAVLAAWEQMGTDAVIAVLEGQPTPKDRLAMLFTMTADIPAELLGTEVALLARPDDPRVLAALQRVARRRITYMSDQFEAMGWGKREARDRALFIYYLFVGRLQTVHVAPPGIDDVPPQRLAELISGILVTRGKRRR